MHHRTRALLFGIVIVAGFALYAPNLKNPLFWDDDDWIVNNPVVHKISWEHTRFLFTHDTLAGIGLRSNYYRPLLFLTFSLDYTLHGSRPFGYHLVGNGLHIANACLVLYLLERFLRKRSAAFIAAMLFLIHPLQTEAVAYVSGRGDPLSVFLMVSALVALMHDRRWISCALAVAALLSRETAVLFPLYATVFLACCVYREPFVLAMKRSIVRVLPHFAISLGYGVLRLTALNFQNTLNFYQRANVYTEHLAYRLYTFFHVLAVYARLIVVPTGLHMERDVVVNTSLLQWPVWISLFGLGLLIWWLAHLYRQEKITRHTGVSPFRLWFFASSWFFINLGPTSGIVPINALIYEHWLYFSLFGICTLVGWYGALLFERLWMWRRPAAYGLLAGAVTYGGFLCIQTIRRNVVWGNTGRFYQDVLRYEPRNVRVLNNLANYYSDRGRLTEAEALYWRAIGANDIQPAPYYNLANILRDRGDIAGALELYKQSLQADPSFPYAYTNIAAIYAQQGNLTGALEALEKLRDLQPENIGAYYNIGIVERALGHSVQARQAWMIGLHYAAGDDELVKKFQAALKTL